MPKTNAPLLAFNRGIVSKAALARVDVDRIRLSAEVQENWIPKTAGSMSLRPGMAYLGSSRNDQFAIDVPFVAATDDTALIEFADAKMRVRVNDALVSRVAVGTTISNGNFASATGWTNASVSGGTLTFGGSGLVLNAVNIGGRSICRRQITVAGGDLNKRHALNISVTRGPVIFRCGSTSGGDEYIAETTLRTGMHSLAFTPSGDFHVHFQNNSDIDRIVASIAVAPAGTMELDIPWAGADLPYVRWDQSADVVFLACNGYQQRRIERRSTDSWSLVLYQPRNGPFFSGRSAQVKLKPGANSGNTTLTSDLPFFKATHVGALFRLFHGGRDQTFKLGADGVFSPAWRVNGVGADNDFSITRAGTWVGTLTLQRSYDGPDTGFIDTTTTYTTNATSSFAPGTTLDNVIQWYRIGFKPGNYTSGAADVTIAYKGDGAYGVCRVTGYNSPTSVNIEVLEPFAGTEYVDDWQEGIWSDKQGWPSGVALHKGRLWWAGRSRFIGSVSDDFENFDPNFEGDAGPINRTLGSGPVDTINFMLSLGRLIIGTPGTEFSIKSSSIDEPLTPQNAQAGDPSTQGSRQGANAAKVDSRGVFAQRSGKRLFELVFNPDGYEYEPRDLTLLCPDLTGAANVVGITVQRQPDTRIHVWLDDGTLVLLTYEPSEEVTCWSRIRVGDNGFIEGVAVLPGEDEDQVYYRVRRVVNGSTKRYLEKWALESECVGGTLNKQADAFIVIPSVTGTTVSGLSHLQGKQVIVWAAGQFRGKYTVAGGSIALSEPVTAADVLVGLEYVAPYRSTKLAYAAAAGTALNQIKRVNYVAVICGLIHNDGLEFGQDFNSMDKLPRLFEGRPVGAHEILLDYEQPAMPSPGGWSPDTRLCLRATAPKPCMLQAAVITVETHDKV